MKIATWRSKGFLATKHTISLQEAESLIVKSTRSKIALYVLWPVLKLIALISKQDKQLQDLLKQNGILGTGEKVTSYFSYKPPDKRGRTYTILKTNKQSLFIKKGVCVRKENLPANAINKLLKNGFHAELPAWSISTGDSTLNVYRNLNAKNFEKARLSRHQACLFSTALNTDTQIQCKTLKQILGTLRPEPNKEQPEPTNYTLITSTLKDHVLEIGRVHGDLMSANSFSSREDASQIYVIDWETIETQAPLVIDTIGGQDWTQIHHQANQILKHITSDAKNIRKSDADILCFIILASNRNWRPAREWLAQSSKTGIKPKKNGQT